MVRDQIFPQKPPGLHLWFSRTRVQHSSGSSKIDLHSALAESGAYSPDRAPPGSPRQCSLPLACHHLPKGTKLMLERSAHMGKILLNQPYRRRVSTDRLNREDSQLTASLEGEFGPTPAGKTLPHSYPITRFRRERMCVVCCAAMTALHFFT